MDELLAQLQQAVAKTKKSGRSHHVVQFVNQSGGIRYRVFQGNTGKAFDMCKVGERIIYVGCTIANDESLNPLPFWPQSSFEEVYRALPPVAEYYEWLKPKSPVNS